MQKHQNFIRERLSKQVYIYKSCKALFKISQVRKLLANFLTALY